MYFTFFKVLTIYVRAGFSNSEYSDGNISVIGEVLENDNSSFSISSMDFVLKLFFAFGIAFEIPIATILLVWTGATDVESLRRKRAYVVVGCFVAGMLLTPPDIISQILLALPMWLLYEIGILFSIFLVRPESDPDTDTNTDAS